MAILYPDYNADGKVKKGKKGYRQPKGKPEGCIELTSEALLESALFLGVDIGCIELISEALLENKYESEIWEMLVYHLEELGYTIRKLD